MRAWVFLRPGDQAAEAPTLAEPLHRETPDVPVAGNHDLLELGRARKMQVVLSSLGELQDRVLP